MELNLNSEKLKEYLPCVAGGSKTMCTDALRSYINVFEDDALTTETPELDMFLACLTVRARCQCAWFRKKEEANDEEFYTVDNTYLHVQRTDDGFDYTIYDKTTGKEIDGGVLESNAQYLCDVADEICKLHGLGFVEGFVEPLKDADISIIDDLVEGR